MNTTIGLCCALSKDLSNGRDGVIGVPIPFSKSGMIFNLAPLHVKDVGASVSRKATNARSSWQLVVLRRHASFGGPHSDNFLEHPFRPPVAAGYAGCSPELPKLSRT